MRYSIDTHVHVYHCYEADDFLAAAIDASRLQTSAEKLILCLTESNGHAFYKELKSLLDSNTAIAGWELSSVPSQPAIELKKGQQTIIFIAGNQIISSEGLEVHALFNEINYADGENIQQLIDSISENSGIAVLPWGVGKWLGKRGEIINTLLHTNSPDKLAIADISARTALWPRPEQFKMADRLGFSCLYGTDPLPLKYDQQRIASAGLVMELPGDTAEAVKALKVSLLNQADSNVHTYGKRVSVIRFLKDQVMLRLRKQSCLQQG